VAVQLGDSLNWSNPSFDDQLGTMDGDDTWVTRRIGYTGFAWYRKHIQIGGRGGKLAVLIPPVDDAYEVYWNGHKLGGSGNFPPHAWWFGSSSTYSAGRGAAGWSAGRAGVAGSSVIGRWNLGGGLRARL